ncbi:receptor protein kinase-like protein [Dorcoceras hygrometricum]|uniref:Receptor protein kinase-like protein n=1 Tax=Dorcoceras hygrometricum TaxID=472368 RepID=A0A2Z7AQ75_9LAMI|nr:receptor protein kinase-like protein [Dorcoceras hygrometricum]
MESSRGPQPLEDRSRPGDGGRGRGRSSEPSKKELVDFIEEEQVLEDLGPSAITARWYSDTTNQSVTTPMIALYLSGMTHLSAGHNVALSQLPPVDMLMSSLLIPALLNNRNADVIVADSRFLPISNADVIIADHSFLQ